MNTSGPKPGERIITVDVSDDMLIIGLADGRVVNVPLVWYPRLLHATVAQRSNWQFAGAGYGIHWPEIDEDLSVRGILAGVPAPGVRVLLRSAG
ncbi:MAG TPA: DUF2442 domain-containing protein [Thermoanaerobaculia bacterium]|nr:DUF2442 domain-containing protein [Thermoanaerobaculia bacterium]